MNVGLRLHRLHVPMAVFLLLAAGTLGRAAQDDLTPNTTINGPTLRFDWPAIQIGIGSYEEGPTGITVFRFPRPVVGVVDVRGGSPGTVDTDAMRLGAEIAPLDAIVFAGGTAYGEEAITGVTTGLKEIGAKGVGWDNIATVSGAIIFDYKQRLTDIHPDKRLALATLRALRPGEFPLGAQGAGRHAMQGDFFGCDARSGQGGAFRQIGEIKIAAFVVVNAVGTVTDRDGRVVKCQADRTGTRISELLARLPLARASAPAATPPARRNTTLSLIVTNRKLTPNELQRLAVQVHTSMARAIQPFSTFADGDILFAVSTDEVAGSGLSQAALAVAASELMWDAVLASVPAEPVFAPPGTVRIPADRLATYAGSYSFGPSVRMRISVDQERLLIQSPRSYFDLQPQRSAVLVPMSENEFYVDGRYRTRVSFVRAPNGAVTGILLNPGRWQQRGLREP